jgi:hypothetical protein
MHLPHVSLFNEKINSVLPSIRNIVKIPVRLSSIQKNSEKFLFNEYAVTDTALSDLLRILSIRSSLISEISSDTDQWAPLHNSLANIKNDRVITAFCDISDIEDKKIIRFNDTSIEQEAALNFDKGISYIEGYISTQNENVKAQEVVFNKHTLQLEARFRNSELNIDVFGDNSDLWSTGFCLTLGENKTQVSPYFLRLSCVNGMTVTHMSSQRYFENREFKQAAFNKLIDTVVNKDLQNTVKENSKKLKEHKASLREFYNSRNILLKESEELANSYFNDTIILEAYKNKKIKNMNSRWLSTANSNINAYDLLNSITHCSSHQKVSDITRVELNTVASELFFKGPDFSYRAHDPFTSIQ